MSGMYGKNEDCCEVHIMLILQLLLKCSVVSKDVFLRRVVSGTRILY